MILVLGYYLVWFGSMVWDLGNNCTKFLSLQLKLWAWAMQFFIFVGFGSVSLAYSPPVWPLAQVAIFWLNFSC